MLFSVLGFAILAQLATAGPCDIYALGGTPCVAAHSTTRALYALYNGPLYQLTRGSDNTTRDINPRYIGGVGNGDAQDAFCSGTTCDITKIYDQSGRGNHLSRAPPGGAARGPRPDGTDFVAGASGAPVTLNGFKAYGVFSTIATGYRNDQTNGVATGNDPEGMYAVVDGTHYNDACCFDYGNAETDNNDDGSATMEALYFGNKRERAAGAGNGPWFQADLENGLFAGNQTNTGVNPNSPSINYRFATGVLKGDSTNRFAIRGGDAQKGTMATFYDGQRPEGASYFPTKKQGAIILGIGGDNSDSAQGTFYEGAMTKGFPSDITENLVQVDIAAAGYREAPLVSGPPLTVGSTISIKSSGANTFIAHNGTNIDVAPASSASSQAVKQSVAFTVRAGNGEKDCYSFESVDQPGSFIRHSGYKLFLNPNTGDALFAGDSTFCTQPGFAGSGSGTTAFRSYTYPQRYWRQTNDGSIYIGSNGGPFAWDSSSNFNSQASWNVQKPVA